MCAVKLILLNNSFHLCIYNSSLLIQHSILNFLVFNDNSPLASPTHHFVLRVCSKAVFKHLCV